jgi:predicted HTH transcriptional regulator
MNQVTLFEYSRGDGAGPINIPIFSARFPISQEMEARFADIYRKQAWQEGHRSVKPLVYQKPAAYEALAQIEGRTTAEKAMNALQRPMTRKELQQVLGLSAHRTQMVVGMLLDRKLIKKIGRASTGGLPGEILQAIPGKKAPVITNVGRILEALDKPMTNAQISEKTGIALGSVERAITTLSHDGFVMWDGKMDGRKVWRKIK